MWRDVQTFHAVPVIGKVEPVEPEPVDASAPILIEKFRAGARESARAWEEILSPESREVAAGAAASGDTSALRGERWARIVYDVVAAAMRREDTEALASALLPLYFARVAGLIDELIIEQGWIIALGRAGMAGTFEQRIDFDPRTIENLELLQFV